MVQVDAKLLQIMSKLQILLDKGKVTLNDNNQRKRFQILSFPRAAILDFMTSLRCLYCWKAEVLLFETKVQRCDIIKSEMAAGRKFKSHNLFCLLLLLLNVTFPLGSKICNQDIICSTVSINSCQQSRFPLKEITQYLYIHILLLYDVFQLLHLYAFQGHI